MFLKFGFLGVDLSETVYHVKELLRGRVPYRDMFSHHFFGYLIPFYWVEVLLSITPAVVWSLVFAFNLINAVLTYKILSRVAPAGISYLGAFVAVTVGWLPGWGGFDFRCQSYYLPFINLFLFLLISACELKRREYLVLSSLCAGFLMILDQRLLPLAALLVVPIVAEHTFRTFTSLILLLSCVLVIPLLSLVYLGVNGALYDFYEQTILYPFFYRNAGVADAQFFPHLRVGVSRHPFEVGLMGFGLLLLLIYEKRRYLKLLFVLLLLSGIFASFAGGRVFPNYWLFLAPAVVLLITLVAHYALSERMRFGRVYALAVLVLCFYCAAFPLFVYLERGMLFINPESGTVLEAADFIKANSSTTDSILVWGYAPQIYLYSERFSGFRNVDLLPVTGANFPSQTSQEGILPQMAEEFKAHMRNLAPKIFVYYQVKKPYTGKPSMQPNNDFRKVAHLAYLNEILHSGYELSMTIEHEYDRAEIFVRKEVLRTP